MWLYAHTGSSTVPYTTPTQVWFGLQGSTRLKLGDINHDGKDDLVGTSADGKLWSLVNTMTGTTGAFSTGQFREIGSGWQDIDRFVVNDVTGDGLDDIVATRPNGSLWIIETSGRSSEANRSRIPSPTGPSREWMAAVQLIP